MGQRESDIGLPNFDAIRSRADLVKFLDQLAYRFPNDKQWENNTLPSYLRAAASFITDVDAAYENIGEVFDENQDYRLIALIFWAATHYE